MHTFTVATHKRNEMIDVTDQVRRVIAESNLKDGLAIIFVPHTTAGVTINENADPDVIHDILLTLEELIPHHRDGYRHGEGNSDAHAKSSLVGSSVAIIIREGRLQLGTWQSIFFCEFDGPRRRSCMV
ncbi:MAG: YjbQ family protein, partial [Sedimentisphaerales bacterium]|nr:YjbQ family protein [Sedimentisphaerales bacterium]